MLMGLESIFRNVLGERSRLTLQMEPALVPTLADRDQIEQMLVSLVFRARDTMATGGVLTISTAHRRVEPSEARTTPGLRSGEYVIIALSDSGPGLTPMELQYVFDPFPKGATTADQPGLALPALYGMMKQCDGYVDVKSDLRLGTTIALYFEAARSTPA
jgi:signal transduction histidine kinase